MKARSLFLLVAVLATCAALCLWAVLTSLREPARGLDAGVEADASEAPEAEAPQADASVLRASIQDVLPEIPFVGHCPQSRAALLAGASAMLAPLRSSKKIDLATRRVLRDAAANPDAATALVCEARGAYPREKRLGRACALLLLAWGDLPEADEALASLLADDSGDEWSQGLRAHLQARLEGLGRPHQLGRSGVTVRWYGDGSFDKEALRLTDAAQLAIEEAAQAVGGSVPHQLDLVVYPSREALQAVTCTPQWTNALFDSRRVHLAQTSGRLGVDRHSLRHELMHVAIAEVSDKAPIWLHEGLAVWFAKRSTQSLQAARTLMIRTRTCIPFSSLYGPLDQFESDDASLAYAQSAAMVELLLAQGGAGAAQRALRFVAGGGDPARAFAEGLGRSSVTEDDLLDYLAAHP